MGIKDFFGCFSKYIESDNDEPNTITSKKTKSKKVSKKKKLYNKILKDCKFIIDYDIIDIIKDKNKKILLIRDKIYDKLYILKMLLIEEDSEENIYNLIKDDNCKYIQRYISLVIGRKYKYFIIEYLGKNTLYDIIENNKLNEDDINKIILQIAEGLKYLHSKNILHCDIKLDNIMVDEEYNIKIIDFDLSKICKSGEYLSDDIFGTVEYIAPESYDIGIYSKCSDIWSFGIVVYNILTFNYPFDYSLYSRHMKKYNRKNIFKHPNIMLLDEKLDKQNYKTDYKKLILCMLKYIDTDRIGISKIISIVNKVEK